MGYTNMKIKCNHFVVKRENRGDKHSMQFAWTCTTVTKSLKPRFSVAKRGLKKIRREMMVTLIIFIWVFFSSHMNNVDFLEHHLVSYGLKSQE